MRVNIGVIAFVQCLSLISGEPKIKTRATAAAVGSELEFMWDGFSDDLLDPKIMFWQRGHDPSIDNSYVPDSWRYTYGGTTPLGKKSSESGSIKVPVPSDQGLFNVFYCYTGSNGVQVCPYSVPISIVKCRSQQTSQSSVEHIIIIKTENHSFDSIYGKYCKAPAFSEPKCNDGPQCCEAIPETQNGIKPIELTDLQNSRYDPCHGNWCEVSKMNGGKMDKYIIDGLTANPQNFAACSGKLNSCEYYFDWARKGAIADRFFQSSPGASSQSDMYFSSARFMFMDNDYKPQSLSFNGSRCCKGEKFIDYNIPTVADLLNACKVSWTFYSEGYNENPSSEQCPPFYYDASDNPFAYFSSLTDSPTAKINFRDLPDLEEDILGGTLPSVCYFKGLAIHDEHPGGPANLNEGQRLSQRIIDLVENSSYYQKNTVVIIVPDESGGFYDHVTPPPASTIDGFPYGPRTQFVAVGDQVKKNYVSHVQMEPSSLIKFIEWNWLDGTGQLSARDTVCNNLGDIFDHQKTGIPIPIY